MHLNKQGTIALVNELGFTMSETASTEDDIQDEEKLDTSQAFVIRAAKKAGIKLDATDVDETRATRWFNGEDDILSNLYGCPIET